eukprot:scaffold9920_cov32-Tisochrysis_lutea.AAC.3
MYQVPKQEADEERGDRIEPTEWHIRMRAKAERPLRRGCWVDDLEEEEDGGGHGGEVMRTRDYGAADPRARLFREVWRDRKEPGVRGAIDQQEGKE